MNRTTPDNAAFMYAAYAVACFCYFGYAWLLWRRNKRVERLLEASQAEEKASARD